MCLALPARIISIEGDGRRASAEIAGTARTIDLAMTPDAIAGDWVITHSGFAIRRIDESDAKEIHELLANLTPDG